MPFIITATLQSEVELALSVDVPVIVRFLLSGIGWPLSGDVIFTPGNLARDEGKTSVPFVEFSE